jgi:hypothetical protein
MTKRQRIYMKETYLLIWVNRDNRDNMGQGHYMYQGNGCAILHFISLALGTVAPVTTVDISYISCLLCRASA